MSFILCLVLVKHRKTRPNMTEKLLTGTKRIKQNKANSTNLYPPTKDYLRETCKSQNINPIYLILRSPSVSFRS